MYVIQDLKFRTIHSLVFFCIKKASVFRGFEQTKHVCLCISINATSVDRTQTNNATNLFWMCFVFQMYMITYSSFSSISKLLSKSCLRIRQLYSTVTHEFYEWNVTKNQMNRLLIDSNWVKKNLYWKRNTYVAKTRIHFIGTTKK